MANLKEIRRRITSVKNTRKITAAMSRIAAARLRRAQQAVEAARPYGTRMAAVVGGLAAELEGNEDLPALLRKREVKTVAVVVVSADRGLCGPFNSNVNRLAERYLRSLEADGVAYRAHVVGRKGVTYLRHRGFKIEAQYEAPDNSNVLRLAGELSRVLQESFTSEAVDKVVVIYNRFLNVITQVPMTLDLLPVPATRDEGAGKEAARERIYEPSRQGLLEVLLPQSVETALQQIFFNSVAAEIAAKRTAMDNATDNASQLVADLTLVYNRERQAAITKELMEIVGGAEALKG